MKFDGKDHTVSGYLLKLIANNLRLDNISCQEVSEAYHAFALVQDLQTKIKSTLELQLTHEELCRAISEEESAVSELAEELKKENEELKKEIELLKKPKRRTRKK